MSPGDIPALPSAAPLARAPPCPCCPKQPALSAPRLKSNQEPRSRGSLRNHAALNYTSAQSGDASALRWATAPHLLCVLMMPSFESEVALCVLGCLAGMLLFSLPTSLAFFGHIPFLVGCIASPPLCFAGVWLLRFASQSWIGAGLLGLVVVLAESYFVLVFFLDDADCFPKLFAFLSFRASLFLAVGAFGRLLRQPVPRSLPRIFSTIAQCAVPVGCWLYFIALMAR